MVETRQAYKAMITRSKRNGYTKFMTLTEKKKIKKEIVKNKKTEESCFCVPVVTVDKSIQTDFVDIDDNCSIQSDVTELDDLEEYAKNWRIRWFQEKEKEPDYWNECDLPLPNFDDAHDAWMDNKRRGDNGTYYYICGKVMKNGKKCQRAQYDKVGIYSGCKMHFAWEEKEHKMY